MVCRADLIAEARKYIGAKFGHQGRRRDVLDCGGVILMVAREKKISELEVLGYASFPNNGRFEEILRENTIDLEFESSFPHNFSGEELKPGDLISFDYQNDEGIRHIAFVTKWDGRSYWIIHATPIYGVAEMPLRHPFSKAKLRGWRIPNLTD